MILHTASDECRCAFSCTRHRKQKKNCFAFEIKVRDRQRNEPETCASTQLRLCDVITCAIGCIILYSQPEAIQYGVIVPVDGTQIRSKMSSMGTPHFDAVDGILECALSLSVSPTRSARASNLTQTVHFHFMPPRLSAEFHHHSSNQT